jgi:hypothetical protein
VRKSLYISLFSISFYLVSCEKQEFKPNLEDIDLQEESNKSSLSNFSLKNGNSDNDISHQSITNANVVNGWVVKSYEGNGGISITDPSDRSGSGMKKTAKPKF